jgi:hypothetical protein
MLAFEGKLYNGVSELSFLSESDSQSDRFDNFDTGYLKDKTGYSEKGSKLRYIKNNGLNITSLQTFF